MYLPPEIYTSKKLKNFDKVSTHQISWKSDQNCGRDSALVFSIKMAAVTSPIMLMSQNLNAHL